MSDTDVSHREAVVRVVCALIEISEARARLMPSLSASVAEMVAELDPNHERSTVPTWWEDLPPWYKLDSFDKMRRAHDQLLVLDIQAGEIVYELRGLFRAQSAPSGWSPMRAHTELAGLAVRRKKLYKAIAGPERVLRPRVSPTTSALLRASLRALVAQEAAADETRQSLTELLLIRSSAELPRAG